MPGIFEELCWCELFKHLQSWRCWGGRWPGCCGWNYRGSRGLHMDLHPQITSGESQHCARTLYNHQGAYIFITSTHAVNSVFCVWLFLIYSFFLVVACLAALFNFQVPVDFSHAYCFMWVLQVLHLCLTSLSTTEGPWRVYHPLALFVKITTINSDGQWTKTVCLSWRWLPWLLVYSAEWPLGFTQEVKQKHSFLVLSCSCRDASKSVMNLHICHHHHGDGCDTLAVLWPCHQGN